MPGYVKTIEEVERIEAFLAPSRFVCSELSLEFTTTWEFARSVLPPVFEPVGDEHAGTAEAVVAIMEYESAYCGTADCAHVSMKCSYGGNDGIWMLTEIVSGDFPVSIGRELWGEVKKTGDARVWRDGRNYRGAAERRGVTVIEIDAEIGAEQRARFTADTKQFDIKMFPHSTARGLQYPPLLNIFDCTLEYTSYREGTGTVRWGISDWDPTHTIPVLRTGTAVAAEFAGSFPLGRQMPLDDPDNQYRRYLWGRAYDDPTYFPVAARWRGHDALNTP